MTYAMMSNWSITSSLTNCHGIHDFWSYFNSEGTRLVTYRDNREEIKLWDLTSLQEIASFNMPSVNVRIHGFIAGNRIIFATHEFIGIVNADFNSIEEILHSSEIIDDAVSRFYALPNGLKAYSCFQNKVRIWDLERKMLSLTIGNDTDIYAADMDDSGHYLVTGSRNGSMNLWDITNGLLILVLSGHTDKIFSVKLNSDASKILSGSRDNTAIIWDVANGTILQKLSGHNNMIRCVCWSSDGLFALSACDDSTVKLWNSDNGTLIQTLVGHSSSVRYVMMVGGDNRIITASRDKSIKVWTIN